MHCSFKLKVEEITQFLGCELTNDVYDLIVKETNFKTMQENPLLNGELYMKKGATIFPRGLVGMWKNILTSKQSQIIDEILLSHFTKDFIQRFFIF